MHVLYFHQHFSTPQGATGIRSYQMARKLIDQGHQVTMVCGSYGIGNTGLEGEFVKGKRTGLVQGIQVVEFNLQYSNTDGFLTRTLTFLLFAWRSVLLALTLKYDVVFATSTPLTAGIPGIAARWLKRKTFVFEVRDLWPELPREMGVIKNPFVLAAMSCLEWLSYRSAHRCIGLSPGIVAGIERRGVKPYKVKMIPNGCDLDIFSGEQTTWRPKDVLADDVMAVFTGTHGMANGLDAVLDAASVLKSRGVDTVKLVLIGAGQLKARLKTRADQENLSNVIFLDPVGKSQLAGLMASSNLGLQILANVPAFYYGTSPNKFFDYLASGIPVLTNYPGWVAELILENDCGYAVPPEDPKAFAGALIHASSHRDDLIRQGQHARLLAQREFSREQLANAWVSWVCEGSSV